MKGIALPFHLHFAIVNNKQQAYILSSQTTTTHLPRKYLHSIFSEKWLRSLSIDNPSYALTTPNMGPSRNSQSITSTHCYVQECGYTLSLCAVIIHHAQELTMSLECTCLSLVSL